MSIDQQTHDQLVPVSNERWGIESNCFVCEPRNASGLGISFHHDVAGARVVAEFTLDDRFSGAPRYVHGGVLLAILDEAMAWATIAIAGAFAVTQETASRFEHPVVVGRTHSVRAEIVEVDDRAIRTRGVIIRDDGRRCATATATFVPLDLAQVSDAIGGETTDAVAAYTTGGAR